MRRNFIRTRHHPDAQAPLFPKTVTQEVAMTKPELRNLVEHMNITLLRTWKDNALALIDLYDGENGPDLPMNICAWGLRLGLINQTEYEILHGIMTMHERTPPPLINFS